MLTGAMAIFFFVFILDTYLTMDRNVLRVYVHNGVRCSPLGHSSGRYTTHGKQISHKTQSLLTVFSKHTFSIQTFVIKTTDLEAMAHHTARTHTVTHTYKTMFVEVVILKSSKYTI